MFDGFFTCGAHDIVIDRLLRERFNKITLIALDYLNAQIPKLEHGQQLNVLREPLVQIPRVNLIGLEFLIRRGNEIHENGRGQVILLIHVADEQLLKVAVEVHLGEEHRTLA